MKTTKDKSDQVPAIAGAWSLLKYAACYFHYYPNNHMATACYKKVLLLG
ncbi:hypothetical protein [Chitinophaga costaii]|nr:hypothetical protein [Chitinophaga costaii]